MFEASRVIPEPPSVRRSPIEPMIVTSRPSRIQTVPRPMTTIQWNFDQGRRSRRAGTLVSIVAPSAVIGDRLPTVGVGQSDGRVAGRREEDGGPAGLLWPPRTRPGGGR